MQHEVMTRWIEAATNHCLRKAHFTADGCISSPLSSGMVPEHADDDAQDERKAASYKAVSIDEFVVEADRVTHGPTGAWFIAYRGRPEITHRCWGRAGDVLPNGETYRQLEVQEIAAKLLRVRLSPSPLREGTEVSKV